MFQTQTEPLVIAGVDGSPSSKAALRWAQSFAAMSGGRLDVLMAWHVPTTFAGPGYIPAVSNLSVDHEKLLNEVVDEVFGADRPSYMTLLVREGHAAHLLVEASTDADLIVVGSRGHGGFAGLLLGSVSAKVAEHAACPVLIHHGDTQLPEVHS